MYTLLEKGKKQTSARYISLKLTNLRQVSSDTQMLDLNISRRGVNSTVHAPKVHNIFQQFERN